MTALALEARGPDFRQGPELAKDIARVRLSHGGDTSIEGLSPEGNPARGR
jgi:hypothetical protein